MDRKHFVAVLAFAALLLGPHPEASAQAARKPARIAYVWLFDQGPSSPYVGPFRARLEELGWKEGVTVKTEYYNAGGDFQKLDSVMQELARSKVDVIVAMCTPEAKAAKKATSTIPVVVAAAGDLVAAGVVSSFAKPGGNVTGVSAVLLELSAKRVEILKESFPALRKATVLWNPTRPDNAPEVAVMQETARRLGFEMQSVPVRSREEMATALEMMQVDGTQAVLNTGDTLLSVEAPAVVARAKQLRIPGMYEARMFPDAGGLMSYGPNFEQLHRRAADYVDKVLKGAKPGDLPIEQPTRFELVVNRKAAREQGFTIPQSVLVRADHFVD